MKIPPKSIKAKYDEQNLEAARIIAADPLKYPGGMQAWATLVLKRMERPAGRHINPAGRHINNDE
jgi:hypothetical protein